MTYSDKITFKCQSQEKVLKIAELKAGMILTRDVITDAGLKLIPAGAKLTQRSVEMIINHNAYDPILGGVFIYKR